MIDTAIPDTIGEGLINFDKRRKEFEVLAQIKLLQVSFNFHLIASKGKQFCCRVLPTLTISQKIQLLTGGSIRF